MQNNSYVICRQLGLTGGNTLTDNMKNLNGTVWLDQVKCIGSETEIEKCLHGIWSVVAEECEGHQKDVGVICGKI